MAAKRGRTEASGSQEARPFDEDRFLCFEAEEAWRSLRLKSFVLERGLRPDETDGEMLLMIRERQWEPICATPFDVPAEIVREFYANLEYTGTRHESWVRGRRVSYSPETIREVFGLEAPSVEFRRAPWTREAYSTASLDRVILDLARPGTRWTTHRSSGNYMHFPYAALSTYARAWYNFLCARLLPTTHLTTITTDRAVMLWGICTDQFVDVAYYMAQTMTAFPKLGKHGSIPHPSAIGALCISAGVQWGSDEPLVGIGSDLTHARILRLTGWEQEEPHPRGLARHVVIQAPDVAAIDRAEEERFRRRMTRRVDMCMQGTLMLSQSLGQVFGDSYPHVQWPHDTIVYPPPDSPPPEEH